MDAIGNMPPVATPQVLSVPSASTSQSTVSLPTLPAAPKANDNFDAQVAEQKRQAAVEAKAQAVSETHGTFTMFKLNGQLITRFTVFSDGIAKVTYIPQPDLFKMGGTGGETTPVVNINA